MFNLLRFKNVLVNNRLCIYRSASFALNRNISFSNITLSSSVSTPSQSSSSQSSSTQSSPISKNKNVQHQFQQQLITTTIQPKEPVFKFEEIERTLRSEANINGVLHVLQKMFDDDFSFTRDYITGVITLQDNLMKDFKYFKDIKVINMFISYYVKVNHIKGLESLVNFINKHWIHYTFDTYRMLIDYFLQTKNDFVTAEKMLNLMLNDKTIDRSMLNSTTVDLFKQRILLHQDRLSEAESIFLGNTSKDVRFFHTFLVEGYLKKQRYDHLYIFFSTHIATQRKELTVQLINGVGGRLSTLVIYNDLMGNQAFVQLILKSLQSIDKRSVLYNRVVMSYLLLGLYSHAATWYSKRIESRIAPDGFLYTLFRQYHSKYDSLVQYRQLLDQHFIKLKTCFDLDFSAKERFQEEMTSFNPSADLMPVGSAMGQNELLLRTIENLVVNEIDDNTILGKLKLEEKTVEEMVSQVRHYFDLFNAALISTHHPKALLILMLMIQSKSNQSYLELYKIAPAPLRQILFLPQAFEYAIKNEPNMVQYIRDYVHPTIYCNSNIFANAFLIRLLRDNEMEMAQEMMLNFIKRKMFLVIESVDTMAIKLTDHKIINQQLSSTLMMMYPSNPNLECYNIYCNIASGDYQNAYKCYLDSTKIQRTYAFGMELFLLMNKPSSTLESLDKFLNITSKKVSFYSQYFQMLIDRGHSKLVREYCQSNVPLLNIRSQLNYECVSIFFDLVDVDQKVQLFKTLPSLEEKIYKEIQEINKTRNDPWITEYLAKNKPWEKRNTLPPLSSEEMKFIRETYMDPKKLVITTRANREK
ncbi:hypothetical protein PPL_03623 [Heterostelium album PN500]|uniref:Uncharacterized protein n=1 Tax=Heterostelium pallidum (strain ATCC 26659 / Pp 5 / PN500) TaxID=670386 RepID=D3B5B0_HETP5|nr:hypothetical protein PPL_03623 [Heterostelium album PN500]EFA83475.1 hypothetical protein PPL_03623 [Heterostelium album PN500]|eukprot:XP_020435592.1 hypothetical protein PPL_03623 [Heterostelium album PN500]